MMFKKILSLLLSVTIIVSVFTVLPASVFAEEINSTSQTGQAVFVTSEGSVGGLFSKAMNESQNGDGDCVNCITDVIVEGRVATVTFNNAVRCMIAVGLYDDSDENLLMTAIQRDISPDAGHITLSFDTDPPESFYLRAFILDENCAPLHKQYESERYTAEYQAFLEKETSDFPDDDVLNFDDDPTNNFAVLDEEVQRIDTSVHNILSSQSVSSYTFTDIDDSLRYLQSGDIFCFDRDGESEIIRARSVTVSGDTAVITANENLTMEDAFSYVKIDTSLISGTPEVDMSGADEGVVLDDSGIAPTGASYDIGEKEEFSFRFTLDGGETALASGGLTIAAGYHVHLYYTKDIFETSLSVETETKIDVTLTNKFKGEKQLGRVIFPTPVAGIAVGIGLSLILEASAQITSQVSLTSMVGFSYNKNTGFDLISQQPSVDAAVTVEGTFFVGIGITPSVYVLYGAVSLGLPVRIGAEITAKSVVTTTDSKESAHKCHSCIDGTVNVLCTVSGEVDVLMMWDKKIDFGEIRWELFEYYYSSELGWGLGKCPNLGIPEADKDDNAIEPDLGDLPKSGSCTIEWDGGSVLTLRGSGKLNKETMRDALIQYDNYLGQTYGHHPQDINPEAYVSDSDEYLVAPSVRLEKDLFWNQEKINTLNIIGFTVIAADWINASWGDCSFSPRNLQTIGNWKREQRAYWNDYCHLIDTLGDRFYDGLFSINEVNVIGSTISIESNSFNQSYGHFQYERYYFADLTNINLPDCVRKIGGGSFLHSPISEFTLPASLEYLGGEAFGHLNKLTVPEEIEHLYAHSSLREGCDELIINTSGLVRFSHCNIKDITIGNGVTRISDYFLFNPDNPLDSTLESITIPSSVEEIGAYAFSCCDDVKDIDLPTSLKKIGMYAFFNCHELESITIPPSVNEIACYAFAGCNALKSIAIPGNVAAIGASAFECCSELSDLIIEEGVKSIGPAAFAYCNFTSVTLPASLTELYSNTFHANALDSFSLNSVYYNGTLQEWKRLSAGYMYVGDLPSYISDDYYKDIIREIYGDAYADNPQLLSLVKCYTWNYIPEQYQAYTMGEYPMRFNYGAFPVCCMGGKSIDEIEIAPTGGIAATGVAPETFCPNTEYLIAVESGDSNKLSAGISWLAQVKADENGELRYELPENCPVDCDVVNIYGACSHPSAHFDEGGIGGRQRYICDICGEVMSAVIDLSKTTIDPDLQNCVLGDVDGDGEVTIIDATAIQRHLASIPTFAYNEATADTDGDGEVTIIDATYIQRWLASLPSNDSIGKPIS